MPQNIPAARMQPSLNWRAGKKLALPMQRLAQRYWHLRPARTDCRPTKEKLRHRQPMCNFLEIGRTRFVCIRQCGYRLPLSLAHSNFLVSLSVQPCELAVSFRCVVPRCVIPGYYRRNRHYQCCIETKLLVQSSKDSLLAVQSQGYTFKS